MIFKKSTLSAFLLQQTGAQFLPVHGTNANDGSLSTQPHRISFDALLSKSSESPSVFLDALGKDGFISVTDIPDGFGATKLRLMSNLHQCLMDTNAEKGKSDSVDSVDRVQVPTQVFQDGTVRRSIATITLPGAGPQPIEEDSLSSSSAACQNFKEDAETFRAGVDLATKAFASRLSAEMGSSLETPLMTSSSSDGYFGISDVVDNGEHLEHFHSYQKPSIGRIADGAVVGQDEGNAVTIDLHTDQGFFLAFTPGLIVSASADSLEMSDGFYVEDSDGRKVLMNFDKTDDLVFMMGDGVNQYINNKITDGDRAKPLRPTPHALTLTPHKPNQARVWYGRMVLPPKDAFDVNTGMTFGEVRQRFIDAPQKDGPLGVGCSSSDMRATLSFSRLLAEADEDGHTTNECADNEMFCWFRCMPHDYEVEGLTPEVCAEQRLLLQCTNFLDQVVPNGDMHGDWFPACTNSTKPHEPYPLITQQDNETCTDGAWEEFYMDDSYDHVVELTRPGGSPTFLMWSIVDDKIRARLAHDNVFGWLAFGFANPGGGHNGMNGGNILMALPGDSETYDPATGLVIMEDLSTATIETRVIDETDSAFRHWMDPIDTPENQDVVRDFETTECFTALTFESSHINGKEFNLTGTNDMIWAGNSMDHFVGYHGYTSRGRVTVDWSNGVLIEDTPVVNGDAVEETAETEIVEDASSNEDAVEVESAETENAAPVKGDALRLMALVSVIYLYGI